MKINEVIVNEQHRTCQIQQEAVFSEESIQTQHPKRKLAQISAEPIPNQIKHKLIQDKLTKQLMRHSNIVKPTSDDIRIAKNRAESALKRTDLEYQKKLKHWQDHH